MKLPCVSAWLIIKLSSSPPGVGKSTPASSSSTSSSYSSRNPRGTKILKATLVLEKYSRHRNNPSSARARFVSDDARLGTFPIATFMPSIMTRGAGIDQAVKDGVTERM